MAYDEHLTERIRLQLNFKRIQFAEKKMFGGMCFMVDDKMCIGVHEERLVARVNPVDETTALMRAGCKPMDFTGRPMKGYLFVYPEGTDLDDDLEYYLDLALAFNPLAKSSKKKSKKVN